jgi:acyl carrier protein
MEAKFIENFKEAMEMDNKEVKLEDKFRDFEEWDSMAGLSVTAMLDDEYGVVIETKDFNKLNTVGDLLEEVKKRTK